MPREILPPNRPLKIAHICNYCSEFHLIDPDSYRNDRYAKEYPEGSGKWKCGNCFDKELEDTILKATPNSERAHEIIKKRQMELNMKLKQDEYNHLMKELSSRPVVRTCNDPNCKDCSIARRRMIIR